MEKNKRKLKTHYKIAIILGLLYSPVMCIQIMTSPLLLLIFQPNEYAQRYTSPYPISEEYEMHFDERTFCEDVVNDDADLFYERNTGTITSQFLSDSFIRSDCPDEFYEKLPQAVFQQIMDDDVSGWSVRGIDYEIRMNGTEMETIKIEYLYQHPYVYNDEQRYYMREIKYWNYLDRINIHDFLPHWGSSESASALDKRKISMMQALGIANENGGLDFVEENNLLDYNLGLSYSGHDNSWMVVYNPYSSSPCLKITIDAFTGEIINSNID